MAAFFPPHMLGGGLLASSATRREGVILKFRGIAKTKKRDFLICCFREAHIVFFVYKTSSKETYLSLSSLLEIYSSILVPTDTPPSPFLVGWRGLVGYSFLLFSFPFFFSFILIHELRSFHEAQQTSIAMANNSNCNWIVSSFNNEHVFVYVCI